MNQHTVDPSIRNPQKRRNRVMNFQINKAPMRDEETQRFESKLYIYVSRHHSTPRTYFPTQATLKRIEYLVRRERVNVTCSLITGVSPCVFLSRLRPSQPKGF